MPTIFTQIINRELPANVFHETDEVIVIADHRPQAPVHLLIIPKTEYKNFYETPPEALAMMNQTAKMIAEKLGISDHFQILINNGLGQEVPHVHFHFKSNRGADKLTFVLR
ncbi:MAG: HIT family protein [candidate division Zixibacteria bacterium]|nr:HIT family protein [candidate division Zixibacteria bacterium]MDH3938164.1 HIT family protein [candidate division Zixibacteria bacterium]